MAEMQSFLTGNGDERQTLVVIFLRGGADGLNLVAPLEDDGYHRARPRIAIGKREAVPLDGFYGLNPLLKSLEPWLIGWQNGIRDVALTAMPLRLLHWRMM